MLGLSACSPTTPSQVVEEYPTDFSGQKRDYAFPFEPLDDAVYSMALEASDLAVQQAKHMFYLSITDTLDSGYLGEDEWNCRYTIYDLDTEVVYANITVHTTPPNLEGHFGVTGDEAVADELAPYIFTMQDKHDGILRGAEDFGYEVVLDWSGTAFEGFNVSYVEFLNQDTEMHSIRMYVSNDKIDNLHYAISINVDIPQDDPEMLDLYRRILFSMSMA